MKCKITIKSKELKDIKNYKKLEKIFRQQIIIYIVPT